MLDSIINNFLQNNPNFYIIKPIAIIFFVLQIVVSGAMLYGKDPIRFWRIWDQYITKPSKKVRPGRLIRKIYSLPNKSMNIVSYVGFVIDLHKWFLIILWLITVVFWDFAGFIKFFIITILIFAVIAIPYSMYIDCFRVNLYNHEKKKNPNFDAIYEQISMVDRAGTFFPYWKKNAQKNGKKKNRKMRNERKENMQNLKVTRNEDGELVEGDLICCDASSFEVLTVGKVRKSLLLGTYLAKDDSGELAIAARCKKCGKLIPVFDCRCDGYDKCETEIKVSEPAYTAFPCKKCGENDYSVKIKYEYPPKDELEDLGFKNIDNAFTWIYVSLECNKCGAKLKKFVDFETG